MCQLTTRYVLEVAWTDVLRVRLLPYRQRRADARHGHPAGALREAEPGSESRHGGGFCHLRPLPAAFLSGRTLHSLLLRLRPAGPDDGAVLPCSFRVPGGTVDDPRGAGRIRPARRVRAASGRVRPASGRVRAAGRLRPAAALPAVSGASSSGQAFQNEVLY